MPYSTPTVNYSTIIDGTYTTLTGVQSVTISRGRKRPADPFVQTSCVIELIPANSYTTPLAIGQFIDIRPTNSYSSRAFFAGQITDVQRTYDFPYNSSTGAAPGDRITITAGGALNALGQSYGSYSWVAGSWGGRMANICSDADIYFDWAGENLGDVSAQTASGSALNLMNNFCNTAIMFVDDADTKRQTVASLSSSCFSYRQSPNTVTFSDTGSGYAMESLQYESSAQNTFSRVQVEAAGLATQTVEASTGPYNTAVLNTYNPTTATALNVAGYFYNLNSGQLTPVPSTIRTNTLVSSSCTDLVKMLTFEASNIEFYGYIGSPTIVTFRGVTANAIIQGIECTFYVDHASVTTYLSPGIGIPFTLNDSNFGILNTNRLGL